MPRLAAYPRDHAKTSTDEGFSLVEWYLAALVSVTFVTFDQTASLL